MDILMKKEKDLNKSEYILAHCLFVFGMKKVGGDKVSKILTNEDTM